MATNSGKMTLFSNEVTETRKIYFEELDHIIDNGRWLTSLAIGEIAGIAAYRELLKKESLSVSFAFIVILLAVSVLSFMVSALFARKAKQSIADTVRSAITKANEIDTNGRIAPYDGDISVNSINTQLNTDISQAPALSRSFESAGLVILIGTSVFTTIILFLSEISKLFS